VTDRGADLAVAATFADSTERARRKGRVSFVLASGWLVTISLAALLADVLPLPEPFERDGRRRAAGPSSAHWLGTDALGQDLLSRIVYGARVSILLGILAVSIGFLIGGTLGLIAGYIRGRVDATITAVADSMLAIPGLVLILALTAIAGVTFTNLTIALGVLSVPPFIRLARSYTIQYAQRPFVEAARSIGATRRRVLFRELAPNVVPALGSYAFLIVAAVIVAEGSLSFLGLGLQRPSVSWGAMIESGRSRLADALHISLMPSLAMFFTVLSLNLVGDRLQHRLDARAAKL
jgi:peptide/nickel transport system permease protein